MQKCNTGVVNRSVTASNVNMDWRLLPRLLQEVCFFLPGLIITALLQEFNILYLRGRNESVYSFRCDVLYLGLWEQQQAGDVN